MATEYDLMTNGLLGFVEIIDGEVVHQSPNSYQQNLIAQNLRDLLASASAHGYLAEGFMSYVLQRQGTSVRTLRLPDVAYNRVAPRLSAAMLLPGVPDFAVKVAAHYNTPQQLEAFVKDFLQAGTAQVWLVYPQAEEVYVCEGETMQRFTHDQTIILEGIFPIRVTIPVRDLFVYPWTKQTPDALA